MIKKDKKSKKKGLFITVNRDKISYTSWKEDKKVLENIKTITEIAFYIMSTLAIIKTLIKDDK